MRRTERCLWREIVTLRVGNAPCSWGTLEFEATKAEPISFGRMLDELVETGYTGTELGDWGYMPTDPADFVAGAYAAWNRDAGRVRAGGAERCIRPRGRAGSRGQDGALARGCQPEAGPFPGPGGQKRHRAATYPQCGANHSRDGVDRRRSGKHLLRAQTRSQERFAMPPDCGLFFTTIVRATSRLRTRSLVFWTLLIRRLSAWFSIRATMFRVGRLRSSRRPKPVSRIASGMFI